MGGMTKSMKTSSTPSRADFERLRTECESLRTDVESLRNRVQEQAREIHTQFVRSAEMQAVLDEERIANEPHRNLAAQNISRPHSLEDGRVRKA